MIDAATSSADAKESKPAPDILVAALEQSGLAAERVVFVGDSVWDVAAAGKLDIPCVGPDLRRHQPRPSWPARARWPCTTTRPRCWTRWRTRRSRRLRLSDHSDRTGARHAHSRTRFGARLYTTCPRRGCGGRVVPWNR